MRKGKEGSAERTEEAEEKEEKARARRISARMRAEIPGFAEEADRMRAEARAEARSRRRPEWMREDLWKRWRELPMDERSRICGQAADLGISGTALFCGVRD